MKKIYISIIYILFSALAFAQWTWQNPLPQGNDLSSVCTTDANTAYSVGATGTILKTSNGGLSWEILPSGSTSYLMSVFFTNTNTGIAVGREGTILRTTNGGASWNAVASGTSGQLNSIFFC